MSEYRLVKTYTVLNWILFFVGIGIVAIAAHSWFALFGAWMASLHFTHAKDPAARIP